MIVGFTGTRKGLTAEQSATLRQLLERHRPAVWLHGACVGADADGVALVRLLGPQGGGVRVIAYPGRSARGPDEHGLQSREALARSDEVRPVAAHFARNRAIVNACDLLVACPGQMGESATGGTWYTIRYARKVGRRTVIIWPDGSVHEEGG